MMWRLCTDCGTAADELQRGRYRVSVGKTVRIPETSTVVDILLLPQWPASQAVKMR